MALAGKLKEHVDITAYDFDPDATSLTDVGWIDARDVEEIVAVFYRTVGTSATVMKWIGNTATDGSGTDVDIVTVTPSSQPDTVGDYAIVECTKADLDAVGNSDLKGISLQVSFATGTDEAVITYIPRVRKARSGLSADSIA